MPYAPPRRLWPAIRALLRTRIVAGVLTVIPIWVTWVVIKFVFDTMKSATEPIARMATNRVIDPNMVGPPLPGQDSKLAEWIVPFIAVLLTLFLLYVLGLFTANVFGRRMIEGVERVFERLPLIKTVYRSIKQIVVAIGGFQSMEFQRVVLFDFPAPGYKRVAFLTSVMTDKDTGRKLANLLVPYTPYVAAGYMQIVPLDRVTETNWTAEEAVKWVMSGGIIHPEVVPFDKAEPIRPETLTELAPKREKSAKTKKTV